MKKNILLASLVLPICLFAQKKAVNVQQSTVIKTPVLLGKEKIVEPNLDSATMVKATKFVKMQSSKRGILGFNFVKIGNTTYDLQTNASMGRRIIVLPNGSISAVWTTSAERSTTFTDRGTGYNFNNGTAWSNTDFTNAIPRIENIRTGWPSIGISGAPASEWVMGHNSTSGGFTKSNSSAVGSQNWTTGGNLLLSQPNRRPIWGRVMNNGDIFHLICNYADSAAAGEKRAPTINGVFAPFTYSRSTDGGNTWGTQHILLPGYDSSRHISGGGDQYSIDVRDSIVAIVTGDLLEDVVLWKSTNNGLTFTKTIMDSFKYAPYNAKKLMSDTPFVADGSIDVVIDKNGKVHAFWGTSRVLDTDTTNETYSFYPGIALLSYWNENTKTKQFIAGASQFPFADGETSYTVGPGNTQPRGGTTPQGDPYLGARLGNTALLHMPSACVDDNNNVYCSFSLPVATDPDADNCNFRDVMMVISKDGGSNWELPMNITKRPQFEDEFACVARTVNGFVHIIFQSDDITGTNLQNEREISGNGNDILYAAIPVNRLLDGSIGNNALTVDKFNANKEILIVSQNQPNPFSGNTNVIVWLDATSNVSTVITNISGQIVATQNHGELNMGNQNLNINANGLAAGVYFYTVKTATHSVTQKMIVQ